MINNNTTTPKKRRKIKVSLVLIILLLVSVAAFVYFRINLKWKLQTRIYAIRAAGYPVTISELNQWCTIPEDAENAAYTMIDAFSYYQQWDKSLHKCMPAVLKLLR
jgi:hypothetical protein